MLLQPTSPLRDQHHIDEATKLYFSKKALSVVSVAKSKEVPDTLFPLDEDLLIHYPSYEIKRTQDHKPHYFLNGAIYLMNTQKFLKEKSFLSGEFN